jgi:hypothetical protein
VSLTCGGRIGCNYVVPDTTGAVTRQVDLPGAAHLVLDSGVRSWIAGEEGSRLSVSSVDVSAEDRNVQWGGRSPFVRPGRYKQAR